MANQTVGERKFSVVLAEDGVFEGNVLEWSEDLELLEVTSPADFGTEQLDG